MSAKLISTIVSTFVSTNMDHMSVCAEMAMNQGGTSQHVKVITITVIHVQTLVKFSNWSTGNAFKLQKIKMSRCND